MSIPRPTSRLSVRTNLRAGERVNPEYDLACRACYLECRTAPTDPQTCRNACGAQFPACILQP